MSEFKCPECDAAVTARHRREAEMQWVCECGNTVTDQLAAVLRLGPYAPKNRTPECPLPPMDGFVRVYCDERAPGWFYERITEPDPRDRSVWFEGLRAARAMAKRGEW